MKRRSWKKLEDSPRKKKLMGCMREEEEERGKNGM